MFDVLPNVILTGEEVKKKSQKEVKNLRFEKGVEKKMNMSSKSSKGSWRRKTLKQCYQCKGKGHIAQNYQVMRKSPSWMDKGKETGSSKGKRWTEGKRKYLSTFEFYMPGM